MIARCTSVIIFLFGCLTVTTSMPRISRRTYLKFGAKSLTFNYYLYGKDRFYLFERTFYLFTGIVPLEIRISIGCESID